MFAQRSALVDGLERLSEHPLAAEDVRNARRKESF
jgi:hypothetical protein